MAKLCRVEKQLEYIIHKTKSFKDTRNTRFVEQEPHNLRSPVPIVTQYICILYMIFVHDNGWIDGLIDRQTDG